MTSNRQRAPADQPGTQQRSERLVARFVSQRKCETRIGGRGCSKATVAGLAGEQRVVAQVLVVHLAEGTDAAGVAEPRNTNALAQGQTRQGVNSQTDGIIAANDFMLRNDGHSRVR